MVNSRERDLRTSHHQPAQCSTPNFDTTLQPSRRPPQRNPGSCCN